MRERDLRRGSALPLLLLVLAAGIGAGAWNYHRNLEVEKAAPRPYAGYDDAELAALIDAYAEETERLEVRAASAPRDAGRTQDSAMLGERIEAFDRARRSGAAQRRMQGEASRHAALLDALREEQALRAQRGSGLALHWRRLTTF